MNQEDLHNRKGLTTFLVVMALNIAFFFYISFVHPGIPDNPGENYNKEAGK